MFQDFLVLFNCLIWKLLHIQLRLWHLQRVRIFKFDLVDFSPRTKSWAFTCLEFTTGIYQKKTKNLKTEMRIQAEYGRMTQDSGAR